MMYYIGIWWWVEILSLYYTELLWPRISLSFVMREVHDGMNGCCEIVFESLHEVDI